MNKYVLQMKFFNLYCLRNILMMIFHSRYNCSKINKIQNKKLLKLISAASKIELYQKKFEEAGIQFSDIKTIEDLKKIPPLTKEEYREWMNRELGSEEAKWYKRTTTSGSTGIPTTNIYPPKEYSYHYMMDLFCWLKGGYNPFLGKTLTCAPGDEHVGKGAFIQKFGILRRECFSMEWDRKDIIEKINSYKPDFILGYSAELSYIAQYALDNSLEVAKPKYYCAGGEHVMGEQQSILEKVFGKGMINYYGCTEMADFAYRKPGYDEYEIIEDSVICCVQTEQGIKTNGHGSILATPLYRTRYPLINYEIGDIVNLGEINGHKVLVDIEGRKQDIFYWKSGKRTTHKDLWLISKELMDVFQIRFIQESYEAVTIQVVRDKKCKKTQHELENYLLDKYENAFEEGCDIRFEWFDEIPPDKSGKIRNMISKIN